MPRKQEVGDDLDNLHFQDLNTEFTSNMRLLDSSSVSPLTILIFNGLLTAGLLGAGIAAAWKTEKNTDNSDNHSNIRNSEDHAHIGDMSQGDIDDLFS